jgi:hypothetical protein
MEARPLALSLRMRREAELRYDSVIPLEVRAAISAQERIESDQRAMRSMDQDQRLRFLAAREFALAKACFRPLVRLMRDGLLPRPTPDWRATRGAARRDAEIHLECWRTLRRREARRR